MKIPLDQNRNYGKWFAGDVLRIIRKYGLADNGETVAVALSGGKDSAALAVILDYLRRYSFLKYELLGVHVRMADYDSEPLRELCRKLDMPYVETRLRIDREPPDKSVCSLCARLKRGAISEIMRQRNIKRVAYGHHADDASETFLMNIIYNKKLGSFTPKVSIQGADAEIIRPLLYIREKTLASISRRFDLPLIEFRCPHMKKNKRSKVKKALKEMENYLEIEDFSLKVVRSLENLDQSNVWIPESGFRLRRAK